ncbi:Uncharacterised protein [Actinobacillus porcinus]|uniref:Uncharacterized protein n=1 Tax=Actinobacillus porcinus TaxID=51048 RepID=A0ABY6TJP1_9PAST|nr:Uncharacterised protein [Actinobacillus porcinus]VTU07644.1 Uncharacterised protein [Actinobacillus porcinus]
MKKMTAAELKRKKLNEFRQAYQKAKAEGTQKPVKS